jgi:hypothetical protein
VATELCKVISWGPNREGRAAGRIAARLPAFADRRNENWHTRGIESETVRDEIFVGAHLVQRQDPWEV